MSANPPFESALSEIEQILRALEDGKTTLEESLERYERGVALLKVCYSHLRNAETRISQLAGLDAEGKPVLQPFEHSASDSVTTNGKRQAPRNRLKDDSGMY